MAERRVVERQAEERAAASLAAVWLGVPQVAARQEAVVAARRG